jgi:hypothetical protein
MPQLTTRRLTAGDHVTAFLNTILAIGLKLSLLAVGLVFATGLIAAALIYLAWGALVFLLTGRKPAVAVLYGQFRQLRKFSTAGVWPGAGARAQGDQSAQSHRPDVVDVEVREIRHDRREP